LLEESHISLLYEYAIDVNKLLKATGQGNSPMLSVIRELDKLGIKSSYHTAVTGVSGMQHTFSLVVYNYIGERPFLVADIIESNDAAVETYFLSFIAKCLDAKIEGRIVVVVPHLLKQGLRELAGIHKIKIIESSNTDENTIDKIVNGVKEVYHNNIHEN
jgi:hypothetical protein